MAPQRSPRRVCARTVGAVLGSGVLLSQVGAVAAHGGVADPTLHGPAKAVLGVLLVVVGGGVAVFTHPLFRVAWAFGAGFSAGDVVPYEAPPPSFVWFVRGLGGVTALIGGWLVVDGAHLLG